MDYITSVVIPTFNCKTVITRAIESVLNQTIQKWELLVVDDGSTDGTRERIEEQYASKQNIKFIERSATRPKGANACRNIGIEEARGQYIALLDSDDEWKPGHLKKCLQCARQSNFSGCYSGAVIKRGKYEFKRKSRQINPHENYIDFLLNGGFAPTPTFFITKKSALDIKFDENLHRHQDWDFFIRFGEKYSWSYNNSIDVIIHWDMDTTNKIFDFKSCIRFYQKHGYKIQDNQNKEEYLYTMFKKAVVRKAMSAAEFYKDEMSKKNGFPINFPRIYRNYELLKSKLWLKRMKQLIRYYYRGLKKISSE